MNSFSDVWLQEIKIIVNTVESSKLFQIGDESQNREKSRNSRSSKQGNLTQETELRELFQPRSQCMSKSVIMAHNYGSLSFSKIAVTSLKTFDQNGGGVICERTCRNLLNALRIDSKFEFHFSQYIRIVKLEIRKVYHQLKTN